MLSLLGKIFGDVNKKHRKEGCGHNISEHDEMPEVHCVHSLQTSKGTIPSFLHLIVEKSTEAKHRDDLPVLLATFPDPQLREHLDETPQ